MSKAFLEKPEGVDCLFFLSLTGILQACFSQLLQGLG
jgi:hypothetical protein